MKERPILFSGPMVRALLAGTKTQTRRTVKGEPLRWLDDSGFAPEFVAMPDNSLCPYGKPGDRLWVRESFWGCDLPGYGDQPCVVYDDEWHGKEYRPAKPRPWGRKFGRIPSIHMPRGCSRVLLEITAVRVERLQDISDADAQAEGTPCYVCGANLDGRSEMDCHCFHKKADPRDYRTLWESINGPGSWDANPWVWVVEFRVVQP